MKKQQGFSLIELLLALGIFSLIALTLYSTFATGMGISKRSEKVDRVYREARWAIEKMARELENMASYNFRNSYPEREDFIGESNQLTFLHPTDKGLKVIRFLTQNLEFGSVHKTVVGEHSDRNVSVVTDFKEQATGTVALVREEKDFLDSLSGETNVPKKTSVLSAKVAKEGLKFSYPYLGSSEDEEKIIWKDVWEHNYIPSAIRLEVTFVNPSSQEGLLPVERTVFIPTGKIGREASHE